jgi:hypothetical protein
LEKRFGTYSPRSEEEVCLVSGLLAPKVKACSVSQSVFTG